MGKNYSYTVVVEAGSRLLINQQVVPTPDEVNSGAEDVLGWALNQVREQYAALHAEDPANELTLMVTDHRPGGLKRRARFTHPDEGITLGSFQGSGSGDSAKGEEPQLQPATQPEPETPRPPPPPRATPTPAAPPAPAPDPEEPPAQEPVAEHTEPQPEATAEGDQQTPPASGAAPTTTSPQPRGTTQAPAQPEPSKPAPEERAPSRDLDTSSVPRGEQGARSPGWRKIDPDKITRPKAGSDESNGRSKRTGIIASAKKQKWVQSVGIGVLVLLVIVGFRVFNSGDTYEAYCVDQRTQTRSVTGVACQDSSDTNHRWWYTSDKENAPDVGDSINSGDGTFDEPSGDKVTINRHVEEDS